MDNTTKFCFYSYNSRGSSEIKLKFIEDILKLSGNKVQIFGLQEHFLLRSNLKKLSKHFSNFSVLAKPANKDFAVQDKGRPRGGLAMIVPKYVRKYIKIIDCDSWRIQPVILQIQQTKYLIINTYFPTDQKTNEENCPELEDCLSTLSNIMEMTQFDHLIFLGDLNFEVSRNSGHAKLLKEFLIRKNMFSAWQDFPIDFTYSFEAENKAPVFNILDHLVFLKRSKSILLDAGVIHLVENQSDHEVIYAVVQGSQVAQSNTATNAAIHSRPCWRKATADQKLDYNDNLFRKLIYLETPTSVECCDDLKCGSEAHKADIDSYVEKVMNSISESGQETIPTVAPKKLSSHQKSTAGWTTFVEPFQSKARFWYSVWLSAGKPLGTVLHEIMKKTKNQFHYQIRRCKRFENYIKNQNSEAYRKLS